MAETLTQIPDLGTPAPFVLADRTITLEISEYAGYAGLIVANRGLVPSEESEFMRSHNFRVRMSLRERENFADLNTGRLAAMMTTADVLAMWGRDLEAVVPVLVAFSRGADGIVARYGIDKIQELKGKVISTAQFTEAEFFVRHLAERAGIGVSLRDSLDEPADPDTVNLVFAADAFAACDLLLTELIWNRQRLAGCAGWEPNSSEIVRRSGGAAHFVTTNRNAAFLADILLVNRGLAEQYPEIVAGLVRGILAGNKKLRETPEAQLAVVGGVFNWSRDKTRDELTKVRFANLADNVEFFTGTEEEVGSFAYISQAALEAYGDELVGASGYARFLSLCALADLDKSGAHGERAVATERLRPLVDETDPVEALPAPREVTDDRALPCAVTPGTRASPGAPPRLPATPRAEAPPRG